MATDDPDADVPTSAQGYNYDFLKNLEAIQANTDALNSMLPKQFAALSKTLVDVYSKAGEPSRGVPGQAVPGISGYSSLSGTTDASARAQLAMASGRGAVDLGGPVITGQAPAPALAAPRPQKAGAPAAPPPNTDPTEAEVEGGSPGNTMGGSTWQQRVRKTGGVGSILPMPRFPGAAPNTNDLLNYASTVAANVADTRQNSLNNRAAKQQKNTIDQLVAKDQISLGGPEGNTPLNLDGTPLAPDSDQQQAIDAAGIPSQTHLGSISDAFAGLENAYAQGKYIKGIIGKVTAPAADMRNYGYETGYSGDSQPLFMGLRSPFDGGAMAGLGQKISQEGFALGNNVTPSQSGEIYNNLFSNGWYGGAATNDMRTAAAGMMRDNPYIGSSPEYYSMMDKATREGATSLSQFNEVMEQVPTAAKAAHTSISDTMAQMDALGQYATSTGGVYQNGLRNAVAWQSTTGQPGAIMQQLMQNPMVQGQTFVKSGLMPQLQGLATPAQHIQGIMSSLNLLNKAIIGPGKETSVDPVTGLTQSISAQSTKDALIATTLGIPEDQVKALLNNRKGILAGSETLNAGSAYRSAVSAAALRSATNPTAATRENARNVAYNDLTGKPWAGIQKNMRNAIDSQGHHMFEDWKIYDRDVHSGMSKTKAHSEAQAAARRQVANAGDTDILKDATRSQVAKALRATGTPAYAQGQASPEQRASAAQYLLKHKDVSAQTMSKVAADRQKQMMHYVNQNTQKFGAGTANNSGPNTVTVQLSPAARKLFTLSTPNGQQKAAVNAGSASVNTNSYVNGPSSAPTPNLDSAGSNFGDQSGFDALIGDTTDQSAYGSN